MKHSAIVVLLILGLGIVVADMSCGRAVNEEVAIYSDSACVTPVENIAWGDMIQGTSITQDVYIKNEATVTVGVTVVSDLPASTGTVSADAITGLAPNDSVLCTLALSTNPDAAVGSIDFEITFESVAQ